MSNQSDDVLLVSDMTDRVNWGARGASLALYEMLDASFSSVEAIPSWYADEGGGVPVGTFLPAFLADPLIHRRGRYRLLSAYYQFERATGTKPDYIEKASKLSAKNIVKHKKKRE